MHWKPWLSFLAALSGLMVVISGFWWHRPAGLSEEGALADAEPGVSAVNDVRRQDGKASPPSPASIEGGASVAGVAADPLYALSPRYGFIPFLADGSPAQLAAEFHHVAVGDVTGDGRDDLVSLGTTEDPGLGMLYVFPQSAAGTLLSPVRYELEDGDAILGLSLADMDGDGTSDVIVTRGQGVEILMGDTRAAVVRRVHSMAADGLEPSFPAVSFDVDLDGAMDLVLHLQVTHAATSDMTLDRRSRFRVLYGDGAGSVSHTADFGHFGVETGDYGHYDSDEVTSLAVADVNGDGLPDLVTVSRKFVFVEQSNPPYLSLYLSEGIGQFAEAHEIALGDWGAESIAAGDFSGDGLVDLALANSWPGPLNIVTQKRSGFALPPDYSRTRLGFTVPMQAVDLDGDGRLDLLMGHSVSGAVSHYLQKDGTLGEAIVTGLPNFTGVPVPGEISTSGVATGDLNSDGCRDVAVAASFSGLHVLLGSNCRPLRAHGGRGYRWRRP